MQYYAHLQKVAKEVDDSVTNLSLDERILDDLEVLLPSSPREVCHASTTASKESPPDILRL
jgi:hypothetical protein